MRGQGNVGEHEPLPEKDSLLDQRYQPSSVVEVEAITYNADKSPTSMSFTACATQRHGLSDGCGCNGQCKDVVRVPSCCRVLSFHIMKEIRIVT